MQRFPRRWDKKTCMDFLQRKIIINSILYYELDNPLMNDKEYDELSRQLVELHKEVDIESTQYGYVMYDFDGSTGFDLYSRLNDKDKKYLLSMAHHLLSIAQHIGGIKQIEKPKKKKGALF